MPELPEVETIKQDLSRLIVGKRIVDITTDSPKQVRPSFNVVKKAVVGATIRKIKRRAKLLMIFLSNGKILAVHLKLTGRLLVRKKGEKRDDWQHVVIKLKNIKTKKQKNRELELRFCDMRRFGWIKLISNDELRIMNNELGVEPLTKEFTIDRFRQVLSKTSRAVKIVLIDQKKISGIGNIYANDALNLAKINPRRPANKVTKEEAKRLYKALERVLKAGIKYRGASDQYYLDALGHKGKYQDHFLVYQREGKRCFNCGGEIRRLKLGGRGTFYCPACQR